MHQVNIRLDDDLYDRLGKLSKKSKKSISSHVREAVIERLEDIEDLYLAKKALRESRGQPTYTLEELRKELGLDD